MMNFESVFTVEKEFDKDIFLKELIVKLGTNKDTPVDVVDAEFGEIKESVREVIVCSAHVTGNCRASVGYDRQEPYTDYETYKEKVGDDYVTRQRAVTKYRTVTDWQQFKTDYSGEATCAAYNSDKYGYNDYGIVTALTTAKSESMILTGEATVDKTGLARVVAACESEVESKTVKFPGDRHKDENFNSESKIKTLICYKLPHYELIYTYKEKEYTASCFACGNIVISAETPPNDVDITTIVKEKTKELEKKQKMSWIIFIASLILSCILAKFVWLFPVVMLLIIIAKNDSDTYRKEYRQYSEQLSQNIAAAKVSALNAALQKYGFEASENLSESLSNYSIPGAKEVDPVKKSSVIFSWVITALFSVMTLLSGIGPIYDWVDIVFLISLVPYILYPLYKSLSDFIQIDFVKKAICKIMNREYVEPEEKEWSELGQKIKKVFLIASILPIIIFILSYVVKSMALTGAFYAMVVVVGYVLARYFVLKKLASNIFSSKE